MTDAKQEPKLVQVMYDPRYGMQAFFDNGDVAQMINGDWLWAGNIVTDADYHAQAPDGKGTYQTYRKPQVAR